MPVARRGSIQRKLLGATLVPTVLTFAGFGVLSHYVAQRALEDELSRRLVGVAESAALAVRDERVDLLVPGDEQSRTYRNVRRKLGELREAAGVARIYLFDGDRTSRADTDEGTPIGARYYALDEDLAELRKVAAGGSASSLLFTGRDGASYKRGFAPLRDEGGAVVGAVGVDGSAALYAQLAGFRRTLLLVGGAGVLAVMALSILAARRLTRPVRELVAAAKNIGAGDLHRPIVPTSTDEVGFLAETLETMRDQLRARDERLQMMLAGIAHEVRNPLGGMELFAGLLREDLAGDDEKLSHVHRIERELTHLKTIVTEFLDYARRPRPELLPADAAEILREVEQVLAADAAAHENLRLTIDAGNTAPIACDRSQLRRALLNLGKNAIQALGETGGAVTLRCRLDAREVRISVEDTGPGIPAELLPRLFQPFFTTREKGTGLGLAFVAEIARDHHGEVRVSSVEGKGTTFTIVLPVASSSDIR